MVYRLLTLLLRPLAWWGRLRVTGLELVPETGPLLVVPNHDLTLAKGAVVPWAKSQPPSPYYMQVLSSLARHYGFDLQTAWKDLDPAHARAILHGTGGQSIGQRWYGGLAQL